MKKPIWTDEKLEALSNALEAGGLKEARRRFPEEAQKSTIVIYAKRAAQRPRAQSFADAPYLVKPCADGSRPFGDGSYSGSLTRKRRIRRDVPYKDVA